MSNEPNLGQFKTWGELLLAALTKKREIQIYNGERWVDSSLNAGLSSGNSFIAAALSSYRLKPKTKIVYFSYKPGKSEYAPWRHSTHLFDTESEATAGLVGNWRTATVEIEVDE